MNVGNKSIPNTRFLECVEKTKAFYGNRGFEPAEPDVAAREFGYSNGLNGAYRMKLADLRLFGLFTSRGNPQVSSLGKQVTYPETDEEKGKAIMDSLMSVELYKLIYDKYKLNPPDKLWSDIHNWTGLTINDSESIQHKVRELYYEDIKNIETTGLVGQLTPKVEAQNKLVDQQKEAKSEIESVENASAKLITKYGTVIITDNDTVEIARSYLKLLEKNFKLQEEAK